MPKDQKIRRPPKIDRKILFQTSKKYKNKIIKGNFRIISKNNSIWIIISEEINNVMTPNVLYTFVTCNKFGDL